MRALGGACEDELFLEQAMIAAAFVEADDDVELRHCGRLPRRAGDGSDVAKASMLVEVRTCCGDDVRIKTNLRTTLDAAPPANTRSGVPHISAQTS